MRTRKAEVEITYNGAAVTTKLAKYETEVTYTDPASGEAVAKELQSARVAASRPLKQPRSRVVAMVVFLFVGLGVTGFQGKPDLGLGAISPAGRE